jgi:predicted nucleic acid-binding protein
MKVVVADTSPLNYLVLIGEVDLLVQLYGEVLIPDIVARELGDSEAPPAVVQWASHLPPWIEVRPTPVSAERFERLDAGERAAILLAEAQTPPVLLLIDDADGRVEAERRHIPTTGTLGILRAAPIREFADLPAALGLLRATNFRCARPSSTSCWPKICNAGSSTIEEARASCF